MRIIIINNLKWRLLWLSERMHWKQLTHCRQSIKKRITGMEKFFDVYCDFRSCLHLRLLWKGLKDQFTIYLILEVMRLRPWVREDVAVQSHTLVVGPGDLNLVFLDLRKFLCATPPHWKFLILFIKAFHLTVKRSSKWKKHWLKSSGYSNYTF